MKCIVLCYIVGNSYCKMASAWRSFPDSLSWLPTGFYRPVLFLVGPQRGNNRSTMRNSVRNSQEFTSSTTWARGGLSFHNRRVNFSNIALILLLNIEAGGYTHDWLPSSIFFSWSTTCIRKDNRKCVKVKHLSRKLEWLEESDPLELHL